ncbi:MAG: YetF domain-containing protein [Betaproteobacteria bacterium]
MAMFDLGEVFGLTVPAVELIVRGSVMFWFLVLVFRVALRRDVGSMGITDFLFVVLLGDAAQNGMIGDATSTSDCIVLISTLVFWNVLIDWATWRFPRIERLLAARRLCLVRDGRRNRRNMRREHISDDELMAKVRGQGLEDLAGIKRMYLESDGEISLIRVSDPDDPPKKTAARIP